MSIRKFFIRKSDFDTLPKSSPQKGCLFRPFMPKQGMRLAPTVRSKPLSKQEIENFDLRTGTSEKDCRSGELYLDELRTGARRPRSSKRTAFAEPDVIILPTDGSSDPTVQGKKRRKKLLQFHDNRRPSKYGYWLSVSRKISGRRPFAKDERVFNYEIDSDDEWEDEGEGDDCKSDDDDEESEIDREADDEDKSFFVDHGYLSPSENASDEEDADPESRRERGKAKLLTFEAEMESRKVKRLRLIQYGPYWPSGNRDDDDPNWSLKLAGFKTITLSATKSISTSFSLGVQKAATPLCSKTPRSEKKASSKRKIQGRGDGGKEPKRVALSLP